MSGLSALLTGRLLAERYRVGEVIGRGGFAVVYEAHDERLDRTVALKVITLAEPEGPLAEELRARFQREARASAGLQHPNVVSIYDFGTDEALGLDFLVMERLRGEDLRARLRRPDPLPLPEAMRILIGAAMGIAAGHQAGIIHRDVKPGNLFLADLEGSSRSRVRVLDFGIALLAAADETTRLTGHGIPLSVPYASPEQLAGAEELTPASDVFSLGAVAYEVLARKRPYSGKALHALEERASAPTPLSELNPEVPPAVAAAVHRALSPDPDRRFPDAGSFAEALQEGGGTGAAAAGEHGAEAEHPPLVVAQARPPRAAPPVRPRRRRVVPALVVAGLLAAAAAGAFLVLGDGAGEGAPVAARTGEGPSGVAAPVPGTAPEEAVGDTVPGSADPVTGNEEGASPETTGTETPSAGATPAPRQPPAARARRAPRETRSAPTTPTVSPPARELEPAEPAPRTRSIPASTGSEFRENLSHPCQSRPSSDDAMTCLTDDLAAADRELNAVYRETLSRLDPAARSALVESQRAWLGRYDAVITSYYSTPWGAHSRIRVLPSQIQALRDRTDYLRSVASAY